MSGAVVWFTGLPASGKTTLARRVRDVLREIGMPVCILDGDEVRDAIRPRPGYSPRERADVYETISNLAALLANQDLVVLVPATAHRRVYREHARSIAPRFFEIHIATPRAQCAQQDYKGLYRGDLTQLPGEGVEYEEPSAPDVIADGGHDRDAIACIVGLLRQELMLPIGNERSLYG